MPNKTTHRIKTGIACIAAVFASVGVATAAHHEHGYGDKAKKRPNIVEVAQSNPDFSTLVTALKAADLAETLSGDGPFTVFAPTNAAFEKLPQGKLQKLLNPKNKKKLAAILSYHVVPGKVMSGDVETMRVKTVEGSKASLEAKGKRVMIDGAEVIKADIKAGNGVIHVIDSVIMP